MLAEASPYAAMFDIEISLVWQNFLGELVSK